MNDEYASDASRSGRREELGEDAFFVPEPIMGGEDFSAYLQATPGAFFIVGAGGDGNFPHHHPRFDWDEGAMRNGIAVFVRLALDYLSPERVDTAAAASTSPA